MDSVTRWVHLVAVAVYLGATLAVALVFLPAMETVEDPALQRRLLARGLRPYNVLSVGALLPRFTPRQADLVMVIGTVTMRQAPILKRVYEQVAEPKWVMAFGACASTGGFYDNYTTLPGIDMIIPVDVYVPGCPPRPEGVLDGLMALQRKIQRSKHTPDRVAAAAR